MKAWIVITQDILLPKMFNVTAKESRVLFLRRYYDKLEQSDQTCTTKWPTELDNSSVRICWSRVNIYTSLLPAKSNID